ncbi:MAG TPA: hypothetical protein VII33_11515 [Nakamurella sp.]
MSSTNLDEMFEPKGADPVSNDDAGGAEDFDDLELEPMAKRRLHPLTGALLLALFGIAAFAGGVAVQKSHGTAAASGVPTGFPAALAGGFGNLGGPAGAAGATGSTSSSSAASAAVIGQVVSISGSTLTVRNFGGKTVIVHLPAGTTVSRTTSVPLSTLVAGSTVTVAGTTGSDGSVTATAVTTRGTG